MKTNPYVAGLMLMLATALLALAIPAQRGPTAVAPRAEATAVVCNDTGPGNGARQGNAAGTCTGTCSVAATDTTPLVLSNEAQVALLFQIDEERMARELYTAFGAKWSLPPFANIPQAEARHEAVLRQLATRAGLTLPTAAAGTFDSGEVQKRYNALLALGSESADSALRVGAYVEEVDIADLNTLSATTDSPALNIAATALKAASGHHLQAFVGVLATRGFTYTPQVLTTDEYQAMPAAAGRGMGCGRGQGDGQGQGRGRGQGRGCANCPTRG